MATAHAQNPKNKKASAGDSVTAQSFCLPGDPTCYPVPDVTPDGANVNAIAGPNSYSFTLTNWGKFGTIDLGTSCSGAVTACSASPSSVSLAANASTTILVSYTGSSSGGTGTVTLTGTGRTGGNADYGWINATVSTQHRAPVLASAQNGSLRDLARCIASCFENVRSYSTPSYTTMDVPRSVTLTYRSWQAHPYGTVQIDAVDSSQTPADSLSLLLKRANGSFVTFTNGTQEIFFRGGAQNGTTRLAAQFDASGQPTSDSSYSAIVKSYWRDSTVLQSTMSVRVLVVNEASSPYGAGWAVAGVQRVYPQTDGGVVVVDGAGSASFFGGACVPSSACTFAAPSGDFSVLSTGNNGYKRHYPDGTDYNFTSTGLLSTVVDRFGNTSQYFFDGSNRLTSIQDPAGANTLFAYDAGTGKLSSITTLGVRLSGFSIDASGDLRTVTDPDNVTAFHADYSAGSHRLAHIVDRRGASWDYGYASDGSLQSIQAPTITTSGTQARPTTSISGPVARIIASITGGAGSAGHPVPRGIDTRATVTNPRGYATNFTLNQWGSPTIVQDALGRSSTLAYDPTTGQPDTITAVSGRRTTYTWDGPRLTQVVDGPTTVHIQYETVFNQPTHVYGDVTEQWWTYDTNKSSRPLLTSRVAGQGPTTYSFDTNGRILTVTDTLGHVTRWYHGPIGGIANTDSISAPGLLPTRFTYDIRGRLITTRHPDGSIDSTYYDTMNRVITQVDGFQRRTSFAYDSVLLRSVTDARSQQYIFTRNALGWIEQETRPGSAVPILAAYDVDGNVISATNRRGGQVTHSFDALDRDTLITADGQTTHVRYGANDQYVSVVNAESSDSLVMDGYGRLLQHNVSRSGNTYSIAYSLANDDRLLGFSATSPAHWSGSRGPSFKYDSTKNVDTLTSSLFAGQATITWNRDGVPTQLTYPNGMTATSTYTSAHDPVSLLFSNSSPGAYFRRDSLGRIIQRAPANLDNASNYRFNPDGSLAEWSSIPQSLCRQFDPSYGYSDCAFYLDTPIETYSYDAVGNDTTAGASYTANRLTGAKGYSMTYDEDGNLKSKSASGFSQTLNWNSLGQLTSVTTNGTTVTFGYDGLGRRVRKSVSGGATTGYLYAGDDLFMELDGSGNPVTEYAFLPSVDAPFAMSKAGQTYYFTQDPVSNNITSLVRASDNSVQASYFYTPFGMQGSGTFDNVGNSLQFAAREYDSTSKLLYFRARYYDPQVGRFISEDPIGLGGGINPYVYASNDPVNGSDPSGLCTWHMHYHDWNTGADSEWDEEGSCAGTAGPVAFHPRGYGSGPIGSPLGGGGGLGGSEGGHSEPGTAPPQPPGTNGHQVLVHMCEMDAGQFVYNGALTLAGLKAGVGLSNFLTSAGKVIGAGVGAATSGAAPVLGPGVAEGFAANGMVVPATSALKYAFGAAGGSPNPYAAGTMLHALYSFGKFVPGWGNGEDLAEATSSCSGAYRTR